MLSHGARATPWARRGGRVSLRRCVLARGRAQVHFQNKLVIRVIYSEKSRFLLLRLGCCDALNPLSFWYIFTEF